ncbi:MAG TPA: MFS transporter [Steroidobacteraceae bacterium]|nr:MFS transporter [Steroidobacteraceae bacterium]
MSRSEQPMGPPVRSHTLILCFLVAICEGVDLQAAGVAAAGLAAQYHPSPVALGMFFSASTLGLLLGALIGGRISDHIGRKSVLVVSIAAFGVFSLLTPLGWDMTSLCGARLLTGLGLGGAFPNLIALVSEAAPANQRRAQVAAVYAANPLGGALISGMSLLISKGHWSWIFIAGGVLPLCLTPVIALRLAESPAFLGLSQERLAAAAGPNVRAISALFTQGRALRTLLLWSSFFLGLLTLYLLLNWLPTLLTQRGLSRATTGMAQIAFNVGGAIAALMLGRAFESRRSTATVVIVFLAAPVLLAALAQASASVSLILLIVLALGCAVMASQAYLYGAAPIGYPTEVRGFGVGAAIAAGRLGSIVGPALAGFLSAAGHNSSQLLLDLVPIATACGVLAIILALRTSARSP